MSYYQINKERLLARASQYRKENKENLKEYFKKRYEQVKNNTDFKARIKKYVDEHKEENKRKYILKSKKPKRTRKPKFKKEIKKTNKEIVFNYAKDCYVDDIKVYFD